MWVIRSGTVVRVVFKKKKVDNNRMRGRSCALQKSALVGRYMDLVPREDEKTHTHTITITRNKL
jgi:hypothetical protein